MEGNIVKMKKKVIIGIAILVAIGLGMALGYYLYYNVPGEVLNDLWMSTVQ